MSIRCSNGTAHSHETVDEVRACYATSVEAISAPLTASGTGAHAQPASPLGGDSEAPRAIPAVPVSVPEHQPFTARNEWIERQSWSVEKKGAARLEVNRLSDAAQTYSLESSTYWTRWSRDFDIEECGAKTEMGLPFRDPRLQLLKGMIDLIPDGYYATQLEDTAPVDFLRISRPNRGKWNGHVKVQTQHSELWENRLALMPDGIWLVMDQRVIPMLMLVVADYRMCAKRYAVEIQSCMVCNTQLTDDRSRHYLIGPICDKKPQWLWVIDEVDAKNDGLSYEQLVARGLPTRVWQDQEMAYR